METLPERPDPIRPFLSVFMSDEDVARYSDPSRAIEMVKKGQLRWQAPVSVGVHALMLGILGETDEDKVLAERLVGYALEPVEALHESLTQRPSQEPLADKQARMLFHVRFALGFLLLAKGERRRGMWLLEEMAATPLTSSAGQVGAGPGLVTWRRDLAMGKTFVATLMSIIDLEGDDYDSALHIIKEAAKCAGGGAGLISRGCELLDRAAATCDATEARGEEWERYALYDDLAFYVWLRLLSRAVDLLSVCRHADTSGSLPRDCDKDSAQFLAYKVGQLAAAFAMSKADVWERFVADEEFWLPSAHDLLLDSLMCEYEPRRDWQRVRDRYEQRWQRMASDEGASPDQIGPHMDLYWAMRIGFAAKILESPRALEVAAPPVAILDLIGRFQRIEDISSTIAVRQIKQQREFDERLPPAKRQIHGFLAQCLPGVWNRLPAKVINALTKAETYYDSKVNDDEAKVSFVKAVEAALDDCLVRPLIEFMQQHGRQQIDVPLQPPRNRMGDTGLRRLSLMHWADVFDKLVTPSRRHLSALAAQDLGRFMDQHIGPRRPDFGPLAQCLRRVQGLRGGSAHYQEAETRIDKEEWELEEIRKLVLGLADSPSAIGQIYHTLAPRKES